jgi:hypothetical protein
MLSDPGSASAPGPARRERTPYALKLYVRVCFFSTFFAFASFLAFFAMLVALLEVALWALH